MSSTTGYGYDAADQLVSLSYPSGRQASYSRNVLGQVSAVETTLGGSPLTVASGFTYLPFGPPSGYTLGNGLAVSRAYDQQYRIEALTAGTVQDLDYTLDAAGNIDAISDSLSPGHSQSFGQDALHRIEAETGAYGSKGYGYDGVGNRLSRTWDQGAGQTLTYVPDSNRMASRDGSAVVLDATGNTLDDGTGRTFGYDDTNRMVSASVGGALAATYSYHASGQRVRKLEAQGAQRKTIFHYGLGGELLGETVYSSAGVKELAREYVWLDALPLAMIETEYDGTGQVTGEAIVYLHADHLNTPRLATDAAGTVVWRWRSDAFGVGEAETDPDGDLVETVVALRFPGQYYDLETGLHYNYFRQYDPGTGRYAESDPIGLGGGLNTYAYGAVNPLRYTDFDGLNPSDPSACPSPECVALAKKIQNIEQRIARRKGQLQENPNNLPEAAPGDDKKPSLSKRGHRRLINEDKRDLAALKALYLARCVQNRQPTTLPTPRISPIEEWLGGGRKPSLPGLPDAPLPNVPGLEEPQLPPIQQQ